MFTWVQRREVGGSIQERRRVPFPKVDCIEFTSRTMKYAHQSLRSSPGVLEGLNRILHAWSHNTGPQPLAGWDFGSVKGSIIPLSKSAHEASSWPMHCIQWSECLQGCYVKLYIPKPSEVFPEGRFW